MPPTLFIRPDYVGRTGERASRGQLRQRAPGDLGRIVGRDAEAAQHSLLATGALALQIATA